MPLPLGPVIAVNCSLKSFSESPCMTGISLLYAKLTSSSSMYGSIFYTPLQSPLKGLQHTVPKQQHPVRHVKVIQVVFNHNNCLAPVLKT